MSVSKLDPLGSPLHQRPCTGLIVLAAMLLVPIPSIANTLANGEMVSGQISIPGEQDSYTFIANPGESFGLVSRETSGANFISRIRVFDPNLVQIGPADSAYWFSQASVGGTYTVIVQDRGNVDTGTYNLTFALAPGASSGGALSGGAVSGMLDVGDIDSFSFDVVAGDSFGLAVQETAGLGLVMRLRVYDPTGMQLNLPDRDSYFGEASIGGTYTVLVFDRDAQDAGDYNLALATAPPTSSISNLTPGVLQIGNVVAGGLDTYIFGASSGEMISVSVASLTSSPFVARVRVYEPSGSQLSIHGDLTSWSGVAPASGTYAVVVYDRDHEDAGTYELALGLSGEILSYAALGDSYSSGEGVWPYFDPTDTWNTGRHQSTRAYATKLRVPGTAQPITARADADFDFFACTGAETKNVKSAGEDCRGYPPQLIQGNQVDASRELITISIGGNDAQFANVLKFCMAHNHCDDLKPFDPHTDLELGDLMYLVVLRAGILQLATLLELRAATPNAPTIVFGYPVLMSGTECSSAAIPFASDAKLSTEEQLWMREINEFMNDVTAQAAALAGVHFVSVEEPFSGHEVCGPLDDWINGFVLADPYSSFHPTARGQQAFADAGNAYLESIRTGWPAGYFPSGLPRNPAPKVLFPEIDLGGDPPSTTPYFGELSVDVPLAPAECADGRDLLIPGLDAQLSGEGYSPFETVAIELFANGQSWQLQSAVADANGELSAMINIPAQVPEGTTGTVEALGSGPAGGGVLLLAEVLIDDTAADGDGDGVPDICDNCPDDSNVTQVDLDLDGAGDECDICPQETTDDEDGDGLCASVDPCPLDLLNDEDGDGQCADVDNCPITPNADQEDDDGDGTGNACEQLVCHEFQVTAAPAGTGGVASTPTNCEFGIGYFQGTMLQLQATPMPGQSFTGWTGTLSSTANPLAIAVTSGIQITANFCATTSDTDGDLVADTCDSCPTIPNPNQIDTDGDGQGNACDIDDDDDGYSDVVELNAGTDPLDSSSFPIQIPLVSTSHILALALGLLLVGVWRIAVSAECNR